jgi:ATP-dependent RNA helicase DBP3
MESAIKAAVKKLKKNDSDSMKIKSLAKAVVKKVENTTVDEVKGWIKKSDQFSVDGKLVSLNGSNKKRKSSDDNGNNNNNKESSKKKSKKSKKDVSVSVEALSSLDLDTSKKWRTMNKVVLKDAHDDENGKKETENLNTNEAYLPYSTFDSPGCKREIDAALLKHCTVEKGFLKPSPIQAQCWPVLLHAGSDGKSRDIVGIAETGSGKTLAFGIPALDALAKENGGKAGKQGRAPRMLVLAPTRELAMQSQVVLEDFGSVVNLKSVVIYGGVPKYEQKNVLRKGVDCIVATPGRLKDLINEGCCNLKKVSQLVLDEADRMLDMGFEEDVRFIIGNCMEKGKGRQTAMFSATWPAAIQKIAFEYMTRPVRVYVGFESIVGSNGENAVDDSLSANKRVSQTVDVVDEMAKDSRLRKLLQKYHSKRDNRILIFALYKKEAARIERSLQRDGWSCNSIHGDKTQEARTKALASFKSGECPILIGTDVASRGLDIPNVEVVLNYTFPLTIEDYVHRIGRTGRAGKTGISHTFFTSNDKSHAGELQQVMKQAGQKVPEDLMKFGSTIKKKEHKMYGNFGPTSSSLPMKKATKITFDSDDEY